ncbi:MAG: response regulator transcription factor [Granulosicoccus sp.]|nr:response regulator transcription factor [Granulosicoccus sp.]
MQAISNVRVLLVEDHADLAETVIDFLESMGGVVDYASNGMTGLHLARKERFDVIVLDIMLPGLDGLELCKQLREEHGAPTPVIMMTARDELNDKLAGFEAGADDYLVKPFDLPELVARIASLVRRDQGQVTKERLVIGDLVLDMGTYEVQRQGSSLSLSPAGFRILHELMRRSPNVVSREELEQVLWGDQPPASDTLRSQIYKLRKTVDKPFKRALIHTIQGMGYRLVEPNQIKDA